MYTSATQKNPKNIAPYIHSGSYWLNTMLISIPTNPAPAAISNLLYFSIKMQFRKLNSIPSLSNSVTFLMMTYVRLLKMRPPSPSLAINLQNLAKRSVVITSVESSTCLTAWCSLRLTGFFNVAIQLFTPATENAAPVGEAAFSTHNPLQITNIPSIHEILSASQVIHMLIGTAAYRVRMN